MAKKSNDGLLYFLIGAMFIAVLGIGYFFFQGADVSPDEYSVVEPAAGDQDDTTDLNLEFEGQGEDRDFNADIENR